jgi:plastocyanin
MSRIALLLACLLVWAPALAALPAAAEEFTVRQKGSMFDPPELTIHAGDKVIFLNDDNRTHNVYSTTEGDAFDTKAQRPGTQTKITFDVPGIVVVLCAIHFKMKMTIKVQ